MKGSRDRQSLRIDNFPSLSFLSQVQIRYDRAETNFWDLDILE